MSHLNRAKNIRNFGLMYSQFCFPYLYLVAPLAMFMESRHEKSRIGLFISISRLLHLLKKNTNHGHGWRPLPLAADVASADLR